MQTIMGKGFKEKQSRLKDTRKEWKQVVDKMQCISAALNPSDVCNTSPTGKASKSNCTLKSELGIQQCTVSNISNLLFYLLGIHNSLFFFKAISLLVAYDRGRTIPSYF